MRIIIRMLAMVLCVLFVKGAVAQFSQLPGNVYVKGYSGISAITDKKIGQEVVAPTGYVGEISYKPGWLSGVAFGYRYKSWAIEMAWDYRRNGHSHVIFSNENPPPPDPLLNTLPQRIKINSGHSAASLLSLNGYYNYDIGSSLEPYFGGGFVWVNDIRVVLEGVNEERIYSAGNFMSFQFMGGLNISVNDNWALYGEIRYLGISNIDMSQKRGEGLIVNLDYEPFSLVVGVNYAF